MTDTTFEDLQEKEVINVNDCTRLGYIVDVTIDMSCGKIISFAVEDMSGLFPKKGSRIIVPFECIRKIGEDIIFVDVCRAIPPPPQPKMRLFCGK